MLLSILACRSFVCYKIFTVALRRCAGIVLCILHLLCFWFVSKTVLILCCVSKTVYQRMVMRKNCDVVPGLVCLFVGWFCFVFFSFLFYFCLSWFGSVFCLFACLFVGWLFGWLAGLCVCLYVCVFICLFDYLFVWLVMFCSVILCYLISSYLILSDLFWSSVMFVVFVMLVMLVMLMCVEVGQFVWSAN